jgi:hypothetical protein
MQNDDSRVGAEPAGRYSSAGALLSGGPTLKGSKTCALTSATVKHSKMQRSNDRLNPSDPRSVSGFVAISYIINSPKSHAILTTDRGIGHRRDAEGRCNFEMKSRC